METVQKSCLFKFLALIFCCNISHVPLQAIFVGNNMGFAYDQTILCNYTPMKICCEKTDAENIDAYKITGGINSEYALEGKGFDKDRQRTDLAQILSGSESYFHSMDNSIDPEVITSELNKLLYPPLQLTDSTGDILRYRLTAKKVCTDFNAWCGFQFAPAKFGQLSLTAFIPFKNEEITQFYAELLPLPEPVQDILAAAPELQSELNDLDSLSRRNLGNLSLVYPKNEGVLGDLHLIARWNNSIVKTYNKKESTLNFLAQAGFTVPLAKAKDPQMALFNPKGNDNAVGILLGLGGHLYYQNRLHLSLIGEMMFSLPETSIRRLRKSTDQGEILVSDKVLARREPGNLYRVNAMLEASSADKIYFAGLTWQFVFKNKDKFTRIDGNGYDFELVNDSQRWQKKYYHHILAHLGIDFQALTSEKIAPKITLTYKHPITGARVEMFNTLSFLTTFNF